MTNEEKINLRERALRLSLEIPSAIPVEDWIIPWAQEIHRFLSKDLDDDPLRLDVPGPAWRHESEMSPEEYWGLHSKMQGIDWRRRQILASPTGVLVEASGDGDEAGRFNGYRLDSDLKRVSPVCNWYKSHFVYHGEIPEEPATFHSQSDADFLQWIHNRMNHVHGENPNFDYMIRLRSIIDNQKNLGK